MRFLAQQSVASLDEIPLIYDQTGLIFFDSKPEDGKPKE
jgi:hypothetical protein